MAGSYRKKRGAILGTSVAIALGGRRLIMTKRQATTALVSFAMNVRPSVMQATANKRKLIYHPHKLQI